MLQIDSDAIGRAAPINDWIVAMESAFADTAAGIVEVPRRWHINRGENTYLLMPCFGDKYFSTKLVSVYPENLKRNEPVIYGSVILNDGSSGKPLAVFDGSKLTAMRTAAVGSLGIKYLASQHATSLGIIGLGIQGFHQVLFACQQRPIQQLRILDRTRAMMLRFEERFRSFYKDVEIIPCKNALELCEASEIVITATGSRHPVVPGRGRWWEQKTLIGIGSYKPEMREFPDEIFADLDRVYVDTMDGISESGDLLGPLEKQIIRKEQILLLSDLIDGKISPGKGTQFFKSVGMAAFDLYGAKLVYERLL